MSQKKKPAEDKLKRISKAAIMRVILRPTKDFFLEKLDPYRYKLHWHPRDASSSVVGLEDKFHIKRAGTGFFGTCYIVRHYTEAELEARELEEYRRGGLLVENGKIVVDLNKRKK